MKPSDQDWLEILTRVRDGDRRAFLETSRLITYILSGMRAYDFRSEWDDVIQDVIMTTLRALEEGRVRDSSKMLAYLRASTRNRFIDSFRRGRRRDSREQPLEEAEIQVEAESTPVEVELSVRDALGKLPQRERDSVLAVYVDGQTYDEAALALGIPLGSLKRFLKQGLAGLRGQINPAEGQ